MLHLEHLRSTKILSFAAQTTCLSGKWGSNPQTELICEVNITLAAQTRRLSVRQGLRSPKWVTVWCMTSFSGSPYTLSIHKSGVVTQKLKSVMYKTVLQPSQFVYLWARSCNAHTELTCNIYKAPVLHPRYLVYLLIRSCNPQIDFMCDV